MALGRRFPCPPLQRSGVTPRYDETTERRILAKLDEPPPAGYGRWNGVLLARALRDVSDDEVWRVLRKFVCKSRKRRKAFLNFLAGLEAADADKDLHVVLDNLSTHRISDPAF